MAYISTVISGLQFHREGMCTNDKEKGCPYWKHNDNCVKQLMSDAIDLLKKDKPRNVLGIVTIGKNTTGHCPSCDSLLFKLYTPKWCGNCGQALNWRE